MFRQILGHSSANQFIQQSFISKSTRVSQTLSVTTQTRSLSQGSPCMRNSSTFTLLQQIKPQSSLMRNMLKAAQHYFQDNPYRPVWIGVNEDALRHNAQTLRQQSPQKKLCAVLKCDAYGHGVELVAPVLAPYVDGFAITENTEAEKLRKTPITAALSIQRVRIADSIEIAQALELNLGIEELVGSRAQAEKIAALAKQTQTNAVEVHLSLDATLMGRDGFSTHQSQWPATVKDITAIFANPLLKVVGISGHLPTADTVDYTTSRQALQSFIEKAAELKALNPTTRHIDIHAFASAGTLRQAELNEKLLQHITLNRAGAAFFGQISHANQDPTQLRQTMTACTFVGDIFTRNSGATVGYGSHYSVQNPFETHATVPGGWNLFPRELLKGQGQPGGIAPISVVNEYGGKHQVLGNPSMNSIMCNAQSLDQKHTLSRMEPVFYLTEAGALNPKGFHQTTDTLSNLVNSTGARISVQLGNPLYAARMLIKDNKN